ncbi:hypothetical protein IWW48_003710 [Coemansia sp. RSA 1200]|nr:hypothetical protein IWW48_003710 [Coemansia sp. RSA 1200]
MGSSPKSFHAYHAHRLHLVRTPSSMSVSETAHALLPHQNTTSVPHSPESAPHYVCRSSAYDPVRACSSQSPLSISRQSVSLAPMHPPSEQQRDKQDPAQPHSAVQHTAVAQPHPIPSQSSSPMSAAFSHYPRMQPSEGHSRQHQHQQHLQQQQQQQQQQHYQHQQHVPAQPHPIHHPSAAEPLRQQQTYHQHQHQHQYQYQHQYHHNTNQYHRNAPPSSPSPSAAALSSNYRQQPSAHQLALVQHPTEGPSMAASHAKPAPSQHPPPTHMSPSHLNHHRPYELQPTAPASRTFWNHYETGLLVQLWLEFEAQFMANKRNAGVWAQLAQRLTERSGRHRTVRECRIKWKNMWAKHRDLANASHMGLDAKLREFPHFSQFSAIRQRSSQQHHTHPHEGSEGKLTPSEDDRRASASASASAVPPDASSHSASTYTQSKWSHREPPAASSATHSPHHAHRHAPDQSASGIEAPSVQTPHQPAPVTAMPLRSHDNRRSSLASILIADRQTDHESRSYTSSSAAYAAFGNTQSPSQTHRPPSSLTDAVSSLVVNPDPVPAHSRDSSAGQGHAGASIRDIPALLRQADNTIGIHSALERDEYDDELLNHGTTHNQYRTYDDGNARSHRAVAGMTTTDGVIEQMWALANTSSSAEISAVAQHIMGYVERESRRRVVQSERHSRVVSALAEILSQTSTDTTAAPSASTSRRSSGPAHDHTPHPQHRYHSSSSDQKPMETASHFAARPYTDLHMIHESVSRSASDDSICRTKEQGAAISSAGGSDNDVSTHDCSAPPQQPAAQTPVAAEAEAASPMDTARADSPL